MGQPRDSRPLIDVPETAIYTGLPERFIRRLIAERRIPFIKVAGTKIRFAPSDIDAWLESQRVDQVR